MESTNERAILGGAPACEQSIPSSLRASVGAHPPGGDYGGRKGHAAASLLGSVPETVDAAGRHADSGAPSTKDESRWSSRGDPCGQSSSTSDRGIFWRRFGPRDASFLQQRGQAARHRRRTRQYASPFGRDILSDKRRPAYHDGPPAYGPE